MGASTGGGTEKVVRLMEGGGPVSQCFVDGVFQSAGAGVNGYDFGAHQFHAEHVWLLARNVFSTHVDNAFKV